MAQLKVSLAKGGKCKLAVVSEDTDVFVLLIHFHQCENLTCHLIMKGTSTNICSVDIRATLEKHRELASDLMSAHIITGCDTVAYLHGAGNGTALKVLKAGHHLSKPGMIDSDLKEVVAEAT